ncbi:tail fiber protein [Fimbriiglobus ruber]|uniref:Phage tail fiber n=1 Tax=Fimbriiglobus ruber TaxID=1908690 RepID=A0A225DUJ5_9BACT|nr:tail fiber protein [Fimbriiglobus ruber]OWK42208.1 Phage tail fiber [Fimbriiglobus ruber]
MPINGYFDTVFAVSGDKVAVPDPVQGGGTVSYNQGYPIGYSTPVGSGGILITRASMNQLFYDITSALQQYQQVGTPPFITTTMNGGTPYSYSKYDRVMSGGIAYQSLSNSNTDTPPSANWQADLSVSGTPTGAIMDFAGSSAPTGWLLCYGQAISRTTYASLFSAIGTTFGPGDGSTTFNVPDYRGRIGAGVDNMGGSAANRITTIDGITGSTLGSAGGEQSHTLTPAESAELTYTSAVTDPGHTHTVLSNTSFNAGTTNMIVGNNSVGPGTYTIPSDTTDITVATTDNAGGGAHNNVQPTIMINKIIKT